VVSSSVALLDTVYASNERAFARFYVLETIARVPYFSFLSVLHLYETLGWWRRSDYLRLHFSESWNELHHLKIAEALGGDRIFGDRFLSQHVAVAYYWVVIGMYLVSPRMAYNLMERIEEHAFETYDHFLRENEAMLRASPVPAVARQYYESNDHYLFDEFQPGAPLGSRRVQLENLFDVFCAVRDDEAVHAQTMRMCQGAGEVRSPHDLRERSDGDEAEVICEGIVDCVTSSWGAEGR
jgi:ubiquinol oxidase